MKNALPAGLAIALMLPAAPAYSKASRVTASGEVPVSIHASIKDSDWAFGFWSDVSVSPRPSDALSDEQKKEFDDRTDPHKQSEAWGKVSEAAYEVLAPNMPMLHEGSGWSGHPGALPHVH